MKKITILALLLLQMGYANAQQLTLGARRQLPQISVSAVSGDAASAKAPQRILASTERALGYTDGDSISVKGVYVGEEGTFNVGALLTPQSLANYAGCKIVGMRFALSQSIGKTSAYIYKVESNQASELVNATVRRTQDGWNEVRFNSAQEYTIGGDEQLLFGFAYNETADMATSQNGALCFYTPKNANTNAALIQKGDGFYTIDDLGNLCVQLIVDVSSLPEKDVKLESLLAGNKYRKAGDKVDAFMMYSNTGLQDISSVRFGYSLDDGAVEYVEKSEAVKAGASASVEKLITLPANLSAGAHQLKFFVDQVDGETVAESSRSEAVDRFVTYTESLSRQKHYVEQYNSQMSYLAPFVNEAMTEAGRKDNACLVNVYRSGDVLALDASAYLEPLYAYTYPCFTIDRFYFMGENYIAFDVNDYAQIMPSLVGDAVDMLVKEADANPAFASVDIAPVYDSQTRSLTVTVSGTAVDELPQVMGDLGMTLMLAEDNVVSNQSVVSGQRVVNNQKYVHNQVLRAYLTPATGDKMTISEGKYSATYSYTLPTTWKAEDMQVVAVASKYLTEVTDDNVLDADITNAMSVPLQKNSNAIGGVYADSAEMANYADGIYTIDGVRLTGKTLQKGLYIVRKDGQTHKIMIK